MIVTLGNIFLDNVLTMMADTMFAKISSMVICLCNNQRNLCN